MPLDFARVGHVSCLLLVCLLPFNNSKRTTQITNNVDLIAFCVFCLLAIEHVNQKSSSQRNKQIGKQTNKTNKQRADRHTTNQTSKQTNKSSKQTHKQKIKHNKQRCLMIRIRGPTQQNERKQGRHARRFFAPRPDPGAARGLLLPRGLASRLDGHARCGGRPRLSGDGP